MQLWIFLIPVGELPLQVLDQWGIRTSASRYVLDHFSTLEVAVDAGLNEDRAGDVELGAYGKVIGHRGAWWGVAPGVVKGKVAGASKTWKWESQEPGGRSLFITELIRRELDMAA